MTIVGVDDTDSRSLGMCTTYLATRLGERIQEAGATIERRLLVRLNPAVKHKTRGNAALALHTDLSADRAFDLAREEIAARSIGEDPRTSPGVVVADVDPDDAGSVDATGEDRGIPSDVVRFAKGALRRRHELSVTHSLLESHDLRHAGFAAEGCDTEGRGRIGALAAVGAFAAFEEWTHEHIAYREFDRCGTPREVDRDSVFEAADSAYSTVWDTVDRGADEAVCVPNAPGPILYGIRGDDPDACRAVAERIDSEPVDRSATFLTNQGTDAHIEPGEIGSLRDGAGYQVDCVVLTEPETRRGGHVFVELASPDLLAQPDSLDPEFVDPDAYDPDDRLLGAAFEPTKRFRDRVRDLRVGDRLTVCGEVSHRDGSDRSSEAPTRTIKLEKFAVRDLVRTERVNPTCPSCGRSMASAGRDQGYRCRDCGTHAPERDRRPIDRDLEIGWYEVPPCARRHVAKPLVRGGFDAPIHPER
ncbi:DUF1743 domain-containing protein [Halopenitus sp. H-Gu1]|uniref:TiaS agmantine-binding domain-containing protein n=1 Tax=Halopenitus sp. H-Gu1 TaxID=3242697 RepID=UPI00359CFF22